MKKLPTLSLKEQPKSGAGFTLATEDIDGVPLRRVVAYAVDLVFLFVLAAAAALAATLLNVISLGLLTPLTAAALFLLPLAYHSFFLYHQQATPGMKLLGLEMRTMDGSPLSAVHAIITTVIFYATVPVTSFLILIVVFFNDQRRTLHDLLTGTVVVRKSE